MPRPPKGWHLGPVRPSRASPAVKKEITASANEIVETVFKPGYLKPPPKKPRFNYIVDIYTKWHRGYLYFCAKYACPGPNAVSPHFEDRFTRITCGAGGRFALAYMRHTGKWQEVYPDLSLDEALPSVRDEILFHPSA